MDEFKVGDRVRIRSDIGSFGLSESIVEQFGLNGVIDSMTVGGLYDVAVEGKTAIWRWFGYQLELVNHKKVKITRYANVYEDNQIIHRTKESAIANAVEGSVLAIAVELVGYYDLKPVVVLKPCPFCGCEGVLSKDEYWPDCKLVPDVHYGVGCTTDDCRCEIDESEFFLESEGEAIKQWNDRNN